MFDAGGYVFRKGRKKIIKRVANVGLRPVANDRSPLAVMRVLLKLLFIVGFCYRSSYIRNLALSPLLLKQHITVLRELDLKYQQQMQIILLFLSLSDMPTFYINLPRQDKTKGGPISLPILSGEQHQPANMGQQTPYPFCPSSPGLWHCEPKVCV